MSRQNALEEISAQLTQLSHARDSVPLYGEEGSLLRSAWIANMRRFFQNVHRISWVQPIAEKEHVFHNAENCLFVSGLYAFTARVVQRIPTIHPKINDLHNINANGELVADWEGSFPENCVLLQITNDLFFQNDPDFLARTYAGSPLTGFVLYDGRQRRFEIDTDDGFYTYGARSFIIAM